MELLLALAVITAVILFGALLSLGNERQRRAIDELREQVVRWAIQDLRLKREHLAREVRVEDPIGWLTRLVSKAWGVKADLQVVEVHDQPQALVCMSPDKEKLIFSPLSPDEVRAWKRMQRSPLGRYTGANPLLDLSRGVRVLEFSILNGGPLFDRELPLAWQGLTGQGEAPLERLWMYSIE